MSNRKSILIIEDDSVTLNLIGYVLESYFFSVVKARSGEEADFCLTDPKISAVILDLNLPDINGFELLKQIRKHPVHHDTPIFILTCNNDKLDTVLALEMGADDYITKPFDKHELIARINACLRRVRPSAEASCSQLVFGTLEINPEMREVRKEGKIVDLTMKEYEILLFLAANAGIVFSRDDLLTKIWSDLYVTESRTIDMHISAIRKKIGDNEQNGHYIETVRGVGYRFRR
ncbi:response regulator transcription factor [Dehalobacter sp. DCM]|uniref:response regulator transcription factor n=1 Tax=Dehalobacter sp. DCM TaxID=2907827 RepID=UPI003081568C|nr:response regulator transcription factor [Dehalobacter sp. DCM]